MSVQNFVPTQQLDVYCVSKNFDLLVVEELSEDHLRH